MTSLVIVLESICNIVLRKVFTQ